MIKQMKAFWLFFTKKPKQRVRRGKDKINYLENIPREWYITDMSKITFP